MDCSTRLFRLALLVVLAVGLTGCGPGKFGTVTGTVSADSKPLPDAMVKFFPRPDGRVSQAKTDAEGNYELIYTRGQMGALVGEHMVQITTAIDGGDYGDTTAKELVPTRYNIASELKRDVKSGSNVIDFKLDLSGEIEQAAY